MPPVRTRSQICVTIDRLEFQKHTRTHKNRKIHKNSFALYSASVHVDKNVLNIYSYFYMIAYNRKYISHRNLMIGPMLNKRKYVSS